jgi:hypothetical protein
MIETLEKINSILDKYNIENENRIAMAEEDRKIIKKFIRFLSEKIK